MNDAVEHGSTIRIWDIPFAAYSEADALAHIARLIASRRPSYVITANLHYAMLSHELPELRAVNESAAFIVADGMPIVWASRLQRTPLPERVAGSDLIWKIAGQAARMGSRLFLLGGAPGIAEAAARELQNRYPGLTIAGTACPPFRPLTAHENDSLVEQIRSARPDVLFVAFGQPKGELWIAANYEKLLIPICVQVGAAFDFVAGAVRRAPGWARSTGLEWAFRLAQEPRRLIGRYARNLVFLVRMIFGWTRRRLRSEQNRSKPGRT